MRATSLLLLALLLIAPLRAEAREVVLVVNVASPVAHLDSIEIRKLFLGLPVLSGTHLLHPLRNDSDAQIDQVFLQEIVAMSRSAYDRRMLSLVLRFGRPRPPVLQSEKQVLESLYADPYAVSYLWLDEVANNPRIRVLRPVWTD